MKQFFKFMFASMLGTVLTLVIVFFIIMGMITAFISMADQQTVMVDQNTVLKITLDQPIPERTPKSPFGNYDMASQEFKKPVGLNDILANIEKATRDEKIKGIFMNPSMIPAGIATIREIRDALQEFKNSGKWIIAYSDAYSQSAYYLATVADQIYLHPQGFIDFRGMHIESMFLKGTLEKIDVEPQLIRHGKFKGAGEIFTREDYSAENREQLDRIISTIWNDMLPAFSEARGISIEDLNKAADELSVFFNPKSALEMKFVDKLVYMDEVLADMRTRLGIAEDEDINSLSLSKYTHAPQPEKAEFTRDKVAVIYAVGTIAQGEGGEENIGSASLSKAIRKARLDDNIKAIVMRVNSPGGDGVASDVIWREVKLAKETKPFVVSMGDVAASGGYWISCAADKILADPSTITGSIGVFALIPNMQGMFNEKLGMTFDHVKTNANADFPSVTKPLSSFQRAKMENEIDRFYQVFLERVSSGRNMSIEKVDEIGQGRVWSGIDALEIGLIDEFGGLQEAVDLAASMAGLTNYKIKNLPELKDPLEQLLKEMTGGAAVQKQIKEELGEFYNYYEYVKYLSEHQGVQARLPFEFRMN
ncbi:MAG: signal peptide peptidase SppA [Bacteroidetes bacterium]|nr:signal peptide peptidase SppA [Bacteroidota bacterium]